MSMQAFINRLFRMEEINGAELCPTYLFRWTLLSTPWFSVYLHHFVGDDWSRDLHDHPKRFWSIGLWGSYVEETLAGEREYRAPWFRTFPAEHAHRIRLRDGQRCWTLVLVGRRVRNWGFWVRDRWIPWRKYVGSQDAFAAKSCPD